MDPLAVAFASWSPYNYALSNPIVFTDPSGKSPDSGTSYYVDGQKITDPAETSSWNNQIDGFEYDQVPNPGARFQGVKHHGEDYHTGNLRSMNSTEFKKEIKDFTNEVINFQPGTLTFEYEIGVQESGYFFREKSWNKRIKELKNEALILPVDLQNLVIDYYNNLEYEWGSLFHELQFSDFNRIYDKVQSELKANDSQHKNEGSHRFKIWFYINDEDPFYREPNTRVYLFFKRTIA